jgi:hypothetical protein
MHMPSAKVHVTCTHVSKGRNQPLLSSLTYTQSMYAICTHTSFGVTLDSALQEENEETVDGSGSQRTTLHTPGW